MVVQVLCEVFWVQLIDITEILVHMQGNTKECKTTQAGCLGLFINSYGAGMLIQPKLLSEGYFYMK